jgi:hypothetical protein
MMDREHSIPLFIQRSQVVWERSHLYQLATHCWHAANALDAADGCFFLSFCLPADLLGVFERAVLVMVRLWFR